MCGGGGGLKMRMTKGMGRGGYYDNIETVTALSAQ